MRDFIWSKAGDDQLAIRHFLFFLYSIVFIFTNLLGVLGVALSKRLDQRVWWGYSSSAFFSFSKHTSCIWQAKVLEY